MFVPLKAIAFYGGSAFEVSQKFTVSSLAGRENEVLPVGGYLPAPTGGKVGAGECARLAGQ